MTAEQRDRIADAWVVLCNSEIGSAEHDASFWAFGKLYDLVGEQPDVAWELIHSILHRDHGDKVLMNLSAGPLEELLVEHGAAFIDRVEREALRDPQFIVLLGGVWKSTMDDRVWARVEAARGQPW
jgi:hypothetical protein